jgi:hypothetical protein
LDGVIDLNSDGRPVRALLEAAADLSRRLGSPDRRNSDNVVPARPPPRNPDRRARAKPLRDGADT